MGNHVPVHLQSNNVKFESPNLYYWEMTWGMGMRSTTGQFLHLIYIDPNYNFSFPIYYLLHCNIASTVM